MQAELELARIIAKHINERCYGFNENQCVDLHKKMPNIIRLISFLLEYTLTKELIRYVNTEVDEYGIGYVRIDCRGKFLVHITLRNSPYAEYAVKSKNNVHTIECIDKMPEKDIESFVSLMQIYSVHD